MAVDLNPRTGANWCGKINEHLLHSVLDDDATLFMCFGFTRMDLDGRRQAVTDYEVRPQGSDKPVAVHTFDEDSARSVREALAAELEEWWRQKANDEIMQTVAKAVEYSAYDLVDIGHQLARMTGREVNDQQATELGIVFYMQGKMSRIVGAITQGDWPSDDSYLDLGIYTRMIQRVRDSGGWPK